MITGDGDSASTLKTQVSARNCFNGYAALNGMESLMNTARETFCDEAFFQKFAYYLTSVYRTNENGFLKKSTALGYIGCILVIGRNTLFKGISHIRSTLVKDMRLKLLPLQVILFLRTWMLPGTGTQKCDVELSRKLSNGMRVLGLKFDICYSNYEENLYLLHVFYSCIEEGD